MKKLLLCYAVLLVSMGFSINASADIQCQKNVEIGKSISDDWVVNCISTHRIDYSDPYNPSDVYAKFYTFTLDRDADIKATFSQGFDVQLFLLSGTSTMGQPLLTQPGNTLETFLRAGTYTLESTSRYVMNFDFLLSYNDIGSEQCVQAIELNTSITDGWIPACESNHRDVADPYTPNPDFGFRAKYFTFTLTQDSDIRIGVESNKDTYLYLLDGHGEFGMPLYEFDNQPALTTLPAGDYTIELTTNRRYAPGSFAVSLDLLTPDSECTKQLQFNQETSGSWSGNCLIQSWDLGNTDPYAGRNPERAKYYTFSLSQPMDIQFSGISGDVPTVLNVYSGNDFTHLVKSNRPDFSWDDTVDSTMTLRLETGIYTLEVTSFDRLALGNFRFLTTTLDNSQCENPLVLGVMVEGLIDAGCDSLFRNSGSNDPYGPQPGNYYAKRFEFELTKPGSFTFTLYNFSTDAYMYLAKKDEFGQLSLLTESVHEWFDSSRGVSLSFALDAGIYVLEATTEYPQVTTQFNLGMRQNNFKDCAFYATLNKSIASSLRSGCPSFFKKSEMNPDPYGTPTEFIFNAKAITFKIETAGDYTISSNTSGFNPHYFLVQGADRNGSILLDQSFSQSDASSRIYLEPGFYTVEVTSSQSTTSGDFSFVVSGEEKSDSVPGDEKPDQKPGSRNDGSGSLSIWFILASFLFLWMLRPNMKKVK